MNTGLIASGVLAVVLGLALLIALLAVAMVGLWLLRRNRGPDPMARQEAMEALGFRQVKEGQWSRPIQGTQMIFDERPEGLRWTVRLPRYNTLTLQVAERGSGEAAKISGAFDSGDAELDARFVLGSTLAARCVALLRNKGVRAAFLALPSFSLQLSADELVVSDPGRRSAGQLAGGAAAGSQQAIDAELELHALVANVVNAVFGAMYTEGGTVFDDFR